MKPSPPGRSVAGNDWSELGDAVVSSPPPVSVIVVHYEQERQLARTLLALERQRYSGDLEVIVVDDGSRQPPEVPAGVRLIRQTRDGPRRAAARNRGVQASRGEVLCWLDADTVPERDYVAQLTRLPALAPEAVTVGLRRHARLDDVAIEAEIETAGPANELRGPRWLAEGFGATHDLRNAGPRGFRFMISAVLGGTRWFFDEVGGFDERFDAYGGEDWEWAHRAWLRAAIFAHVPAAVAWHDGPDWGARQAGDEALGAARGEKNAEAIRLAQLITVAGHRTRGLLSPRAETLIEIDSQPGPAATFICVDSLLEALPHSAVLVPDEFAARHGDDPRVLRISQRGSARAAWPALHVTIHAAITVGGGLAELCQTMLERDDGLCHLHDDRGKLMTIESARHRIRTARWGRAAGLAVIEQRPDWLQRLPDPPDVEAYLGDWRR